VGETATALPVGATREEAPKSNAMITPQPAPDPVPAPGAGAKKGQIAAKPADPESGKSTVMRTVAGFILMAMVGFAILGSVVKIISLLVSGMSGNWGPEHIFLVFVIVLGASWMIKQLRK